MLTLKAPVTAAADGNFYFFYFSEKTSHDISCELSAKQTVHMKCQDLFSLKNLKNKKKIECRLLQILHGALRVNLLMRVKFAGSVANRVDLDQNDVGQQCLLRLSIPIHNAQTDV